MPGFVGSLVVLLPLTVSDEMKLQGLETMSDDLARNGNPGLAS